MASINLCRRNVKRTVGIFQHSFILYTDDAGVSRIFSVNTDNGNMFTGDIKIDIGTPYEKGHDDHSQYPSCGSGESGTDDSLKPSLDKLYEFSYKVRDSNPDYKGFIQNCNTYAFGALRYAGLNLNLPDGYSDNWRFPGSDREFKNTDFDRFMQQFGKMLHTDPAFAFALSQGIAAAFNYYRTNSWNAFGPSYRSSNEDSKGNAGSSSSGMPGSSSVPGGNTGSSSKPSGGTGGSSSGGSSSRDGKSGGSSSKPSGGTGGPGGSSGGARSGGGSGNSQQRTYDGGSWRQSSDGSWRQDRSEQSSQERQQNSRQSNQQQRDQQQRDQQQSNAKQEGGRSWWQQSGEQQSNQRQNQQEQQSRQQQRQEQQRNDFRQEYNSRRGYEQNSRQYNGPVSQYWQREQGSDSGFRRGSSERASSGQQQRSWFDNSGFSGFGSNGPEGTWGSFRSGRNGYNQGQSRGPRSGGDYYYGPGFNGGRFRTAFENIRNFWRNTAWSNMGGWTHSFRGNVRYARSHVSPLVLDLEGDGLKLRGHHEGVYFDIDNDGFLERVGWPDASEGQLARDLSGNGAIDNIAELFGDDLISAFLNLGLLDTNQDEVIDSNDSDFTELLIWQDINYNGYSEPNELRTLQQAGIKSISLMSGTTYRNIENNTVTEFAPFHYNNGRSGTIYDVHYHNDDMDSWYQEHIPNAYISHDKLQPYLNVFRQNVMSGLFKRMQELAKHSEALPIGDWVQEVIRIEVAKVKIQYAAAAQDQLKKAVLTNKVFYPSKVEAQHNSIKTKLIEIYRRAKEAVFKNVDDKQLAAYKGAKKEVEARILAEYNVVKRQFTILAETDLKDAKEVEEKRLLNKYQGQTGSYKARMAEYKAAGARLEKKSNKTLKEELDKQWAAHQKRIDVDLYKKNISISHTHKEETDKLTAELNMKFRREFVDAGMFQDGEDEVHKQVSGFHRLNLRHSLIKTKTTLGLSQDFANVLATESEAIYREFIEDFVPSMLKVLNTHNTTSTQQFKAYEDVFNDLFDFIVSGRAAVEILPETLAMPLMRGYGKLPALHVAMSQNSLLKHLVQDFVDTTDLAEVYSKAIEILYTWSSVRDIPDNKRAAADGVNIEARKVAVIEQLTGQEFKQLGVADFVGQFASEAIQKAFDVFLIRLVANLLVQGPFSRIFSNHSYDFVSDTLTLGSSFQKILEAAQEFAQEHDLTRDYSFWVQLGYVLASSLNELGVTIAQLRETLSVLAGRPIMVSTDSFGLDGTDDDDLIIGTYGSDYIKALKGNDRVFGGDGSDNIEGNEGNDELYGEEGIDRIYGHEGSDTMRGGADRDFLYGGAGSDRIFGDDGDDTVEGGEDGDIMNGGPGEDTLSYGSSNKGVFVSLATYMSFGGHADDDAFRDFEHLGGSEYRDTLIGDHKDNHLNGEGGNDTLSGGAGNDRLFGATGDDRLYGEEGDDVLSGFDGPDYMDGGEGKDTASYTHPYSTSGVHVDLTAGTGRKGFAEGDIYVSIENVYGSKYRDTIKGNDEDNVLDGGEGDDRLYGESGNDILAGNHGDDKVFGGDGDDKIFVGRGSDEIDGGPGNDTVSYELAEAGANVNLTSGIGKAHIIYEDKLREIEHVIGTNFDDVITGNEQNNKLIGLSGNDVMHGLKGNDIFTLGNGSSVIDGGAGQDTINYEYLNSSIIIDMTLGRSMIGKVIKDKFRNVENFFGTVFHDKITGNAENNYLMGWDGDDDIDGGAGDDVLSGGTGRNVLKGGDGNDIFIATGHNTIEGGSGNNAIHYSMSHIRVNVSLLLGINTINGEFVDTFRDISSVKGSAQSDFILGNREHNILDGLDGDDFIDGREGNDVISGGEGINTLLGGNGDDKFLALEGSNTIDGGKGKDVVTYKTCMQSLYLQYERSLNAIRSLKNLLPQYQGDILIEPTPPQFPGVVVNLLNGTAFKLWYNTFDFITGVEKVEGTHYNDSITGDDGANTLDGIDGNDEIHGGVGNDVIISGRGYSRLFGDDGDDIFAVQRHGEADVFGGSGLDTLDLITHNCPIRIDLALEIISYCGNLNRTIESIEGIRTGDGNDVVRDNSANNTLIATGRGNDIIFLNGTGKKTIFAGTGADRFVIELGFVSKDQEATLIADFSQMDQDKIDVSALLHISNFSNIASNHINDTHIVISFSHDQNITITTGTLPIETDFIFAIDLLHNPLLVGE